MALLRQLAGRRRLEPRPKLAAAAASPCGGCSGGSSPGRCGPRLQHPLEDEAPTDLLYERRPCCQPVPSSLAQAHGQHLALVAREFQRRPTRLPCSRRRHAGGGLGVNDALRHFQGRLDSSSCTCRVPQQAAACDIAKADGQHAHLSSLDRSLVTGTAIRTRGRRHVGHRGPRRLASALLAGLDRFADAPTFGVCRQRW